LRKKNNAIVARGGKQMDSKISRGKAEPAKRKGELAVLIKRRCSPMAAKKTGVQCGTI